MIKDFSSAPISFFASNLPINTCSGEDNCTTQATRITVQALDKTEHGTICYMTAFVPSEDLDQPAHLHRSKGLHADSNESDHVQADPYFMTRAQ